MGGDQLRPVVRLALALFAYAARPLASRIGEKGQRQDGQRAVAGLPPPRPARQVQKKRSAGADRRSEDRPAHEVYRGVPDKSFVDGLAEEPRPKTG